MSMSVSHPLKPQRVNRFSPSPNLPSAQQDFWLSCAGQNYKEFRRVWSPAPFSAGPFGLGAPPEISLGMLSSTLLLNPSNQRSSYLF